MEERFMNLKKSDFLIGFNEEEIQEILLQTNYKVMEYSKEQIIIMEGYENKELGIVLSGSVDVLKVHNNGKMVIVKKLKEGDLLGHANIFSDIKYSSSTLISNNDCEILFIHKDSITELCMKNEKILNNFMRILSNQVVFLSERMKFISCGKIRNKIINYLLTEYNKQNNLRITVSITRKDMADIFGVTRPALSNEMILLKKEGLIDYKDNIIHIKNIDLLKVELEK